jgi:iron(III) transport system substrate-binding protein
VDRALASFYGRARSIPDRWETKMLRKISFCAAAGLWLAFVGAAVAADISQLAKMTGPDRERILHDGARKEGKVVLYSAMIENQALRPIKAAFTAKYPFLEVEFWRADTRDLINKTLAEVRSRSVVVDVVEGGGVSQSLIRAGVAQEFSLPGAAALPRAFVDPMWVATRVSYFGPAINTRMVSDDEAPKNYQDLLDPKWKGKIAWAANTETGGAMMFISFIRSWLGEQKGEEYLTQLAKQDIANLSGSPREVVNKLIAGEYPLALNIFLHHPLISAQKGAPVAPLLLDPVLGNASVMVLLKNAPRPHAALLLMDYLVSEEGQKVIRDADYFPANPSVAVEASVASIIPANSNKTLKFISEEELFADRAKSIVLQKNLFQRR